MRTHSTRQVPGITESWLHFTKAISDACPGVGPAPWYIAPLKFCTVATKNASDVPAKESVSKIAAPNKSADVL